MTLSGYCTKSEIIFAFTEEEYYCPYGTIEDQTRCENFIKNDTQN